MEGKERMGMSWAGVGVRGINEETTGPGHTLPSPNRTDTPEMSTPTGDTPCLPLHMQPAPGRLLCGLG